MERPSEFALIARYLAPWAAPGAFGLLDDAAVLAPASGHDLVLTKDMLVAGIHFFPDDPADSIARKALRVNLSDLAAKGAAPRGFLLGLALPGDWTEAWLAAFVAGLRRDSEAFGLALLGGDTVRTTGPLTVSVTAIGEVPAGTMLRRTAARAGDRLLVSGSIGDAALGLRARLNPDALWLTALAAGQRDFLAQRYLVPEPRCRLAPLLLCHARAAMDISDGLVGDLEKMVSPAGLGARIGAAAVPLSPAAAAALAAEPALLATLLSGGDDYEVLLAVAPENVAALQAEAEALAVPLTVIGDVAAAPGVVVTVGDGRPLDLAATSFVHF